VIDWASFVLVACVSMLGACTLVAFAALGIRLVNRGGRRRLAARIGAYASFGLCALAVGFGVYLIVPAFG
jgi:4-amino-4-deoxy-L-arabinose transferase-like glycosyltransferase